MNIQQHLHAASFIVNLFYNQFGISKYRIGLYPLFAIVPGLGDFISILISVYLIWLGGMMHLPTAKRAQMYGNILFDLVFGAIPIVGDVMDTVYRAHVKNLRILEEYADSHVVDGEIVSRQDSRIASL